MTDWGNNPATGQVICTAILVIGVAAAWLSLKESKAHRLALEREIDARMRPWVGLYGLAFDSLEGEVGSVCVLLRNFGPLPAQGAHLAMTIQPKGSADDERPSPVAYKEAGQKALMPEEEGNYSIDMAQFPQFQSWRREKRDVMVDGMFEYRLGSRTFSSRFAGAFWFSRSIEGASTPVPVNWRNVDAT
jgi:hypothetical protein